jgi:hypothetical protein
MKNLSDKTLVTYQAVINGLLRDADIDDDEDGKWITKHWEKLMQVIGVSKSIHTKKNRYAVLKIWCEMHDLPEKYSNQLQEKIDNLVEEVNNQYSTNMKSEKIDKNWVSVPELKTTIEMLKSKVLPAEAIDNYNEFRALIKYLVLLIHVSMPLRNDLACAKIFLTNEVPKSKRTYGSPLTSPLTKEGLKGNVVPFNEIIINKSKKTAQLILNDYKTARTYGQKVLDFPPEIAKEIIKWYPVVIRMSPKSWLIPDRDDPEKCISRVTYTKLFNSIFSDTGKKVSTTQIRRTIVSDVVKPEPNETKKREELANVMGHSIDTQNKYAKAD